MPRLVVLMRRATPRAALLLALASLVAAQPAAAQSVLRDAETEAVLADISRPIIAAAGPSVAGTKVVLLQDKEINAFVAGGQIIYVHSGLITAADNANQVQGVIAHELGHITGGHIIRFGEGAKAAGGISILSLLLGAAAIAAGGAEAGMGILGAGQQAAMSKFLSFSRTQESSADAAGASFLTKAGISGKGSVAFFQKLRQQEYRLSSSYANTDPYAQTHPMSADRAEMLEGVYRKSAAWDAKTDPQLEARFQRVKAKLAGFVDDPTTTMRKYPTTDNSVPAHYARAYAWHKSAYPERALTEVNALLATAPHDPYFLELKGQVLLESGKPAEAVAPLREAVQRTNAPLIAATFGHALIATEDTRNFVEAQKVLRTAVQRDEDNPFAWYQLGIVYAQEGDIARAALATAMRYNLQGNPRMALGQAETALRGIPEGTPDYLRAEDIAIASRAEIATQKKR
ncbi:M48 family metalloprotease [Sphingomonas solaris]|uniref:M48 family metalloprotease n=2 Tax=Alterirhizorhabdus solaris TaxID=2529389 RepID=A0A558QVG3_9SPHN|nr:M48 family metalloprotease [Sphingomonas solaris]TVV71124.1 M48 family metalloprotease [Sphingomonas solaris]